MAHSNARATLAHLFGALAAADRILERRGLSRATPRPLRHLGWGDCGIPDAGATSGIEAGWSALGGLPRTDAGALPGGAPIGAADRDGWGTCDLGLRRELRGGRAGSVSRERR